MAGYAQLGLGEQWGRGGRAEAQQGRREIQLGLCEKRGREEGVQRRDGRDGC